MLYESNDKYVLLEKEIAYLHNYIELEKMRYGDHADIQFSTEGDAQGLMIAPLLLLPLVENAFKHGVSKSATKACLHCKIKVEGTRLTINVHNSKQIVASHKENKSGIGLNNLKQRLLLLYQDNYLLQIKDQTNQFDIELQIQMEVC